MKMKENQAIKVCSFYVNDWHLTTMMLPYINKRVQEKVKMITMMENGIQNKVEELLSKMNLSKESSQSIMEINWTSNKLMKYSQVKVMLDEALADADKIDILLSGKTEYLDIANKNIEKVLMESKKCKNKTVTIINCYEVTQFNNIGEVLQQHEFILNTSGMKEIDEVFVGYSKEEQGLAN